MRGRIPFARDVAFGYRTLLDAVNRFPRCAIQNKHQTVLADHCESGDGLAVFLHVKQAGCGRYIVVPKVMVNELEVPNVFARAGVDSDD